MKENRSQHLLSAEEGFELLAAGETLLDVRAPIEFARSHFGPSQNAPLLSDEERQRIGTTYKEQGSEAAVRLGHQLVSGATKTARIQRWLETIQRTQCAALYCARGGMRSEIVQQWLADEGLTLPRVRGGLKALRNCALEVLQRVPTELSLLVVAGPTGARKTALLNLFANAIDLEDLAQHRGSSFGGLFSNQPAQATFENNLALELFRTRRDFPSTPILVENESRKIGYCLVPAPLYRKMEAAPLVVIDASLEERTRTTRIEYVDKFVDSHGPEILQQLFPAALERIKRSLGGERYQLCAELLRNALEAKPEDAKELHEAWIRFLLEHYYDPYYQRSLERHAAQIIFRGSFSEVREFLLERCSEGTESCNKSGV